MALYLGIDVGTSATKAVVCDDRGRVAGVASADHELLLPRPGWTEQDPLGWWRALIGAVRGLHERGVDIGQIGGVSLSGQMHGLVLLEEASLGGRPETCRPLRNAILWNDQRTASQCEEIERAVGGRRRLVELAGNAALTGFTLPKILWVREHEPDVFRRAAKALLPKDFIRLLLAGAAATDVGDGAGMLAMDVDGRRWSTKVLEAIRIDPGLLPRLVESGDVAGRITKWASEQTGLREGLPVVAGSGDNMMGALGAGVVRAGDVLATIGTSGVIYSHSERPRKDLDDETAGRVHTMCAATGTREHAGGWCVTGCTLSAGGALRWCRDTIAPGVSFDELMAEAERVPPGCEGLVFLPQLTGERCPRPDPTARGAWIGLTARHTRGHLVRAVIEGVTFTMGQILGIMRGIGIEPREVRLGGGGARSALWRRMQTDVYVCATAMTNTEEGPAYGAALLAGVGAGRWKSIEAACDEAITVTERLEPDARMRERYAEPMAVHQAVTADLAGRFEWLSKIAARDGV